MKNILKLFLLFIGLASIQCSNDDNVNAGTILVNGSEFKTGASPTLNILKSDSQNGFWIEIRENLPSGQRALQIMAAHETGTHSGTYVLRSNAIGPGLATIALMDIENDQQLAGGAIEQPTGTITVTDRGNKTFEIEFNDVTLDPGTASETTISGSHRAKFRSQ